MFSTKNSFFNNSLANRIRTQLASRKGNFSTTGSLYPSYSNSLNGDQISNGTKEKPDLENVELRAHKKIGYSMGMNSSTHNDELGTIPRLSSYETDFSLGNQNNGARQRKILDLDDVQSNISVAVSSYIEMDSDGQARNNRFMDTDDIIFACHDHQPIVEYLTAPLLPIREACRSLEDIVPNIKLHVETVLRDTPAKPDDGLTVDESAAIRLYTIEGHKTNDSLYSRLNSALRASSRETLEPFYKYLKLLLTGLVKIPCKPISTVWRGVRKDISAGFHTENLITWWSFSSCTTALAVLESDAYLGQRGERTLFTIEAINGRSIRAHSQFPCEDEVLLLPGTYMKVSSRLSQGDKLSIIHLKQMKPPSVLLAEPVEGFEIYPPDKKHTPWYRKKRTMVELMIFLLIILGGIIVGLIFAFQDGLKKPVCRSRPINIRADLYWTFGCLDGREELTGLYNGTIMNGAQFIAPDYSGQGYALQLDRRRKQYMRLARPLGLMANVSFTFSTWIIIAGYNPKTILSDCNKDFRQEHWDVNSRISASIQEYICQGCWFYVTFSYDHINQSLTFYLNGERIHSSHLSTSVGNWTSQTDIPASCMGLNCVTETDYFHGVIDRLSITFYLKSMAEIQDEATLICNFNFNKPNVSFDSGPIALRTRTQSVYKMISENRSAALFNSSNSYLQTAGFTLLYSRFFQFSINFWLRLDKPSITKDENAIGILQITSQIDGLTEGSYTCILSIHFSLKNLTLEIVFPALFTSISIRNSLIEFDTWTHFGMSFDGADTYRFYKNGVLISNSTNRRYTTLLLDDPRLAVTVGGVNSDAYSSKDTANFERMTCFGESDAFNYTNFVGQIDDLRISARALRDEEFSELANN